MPKLSLTDLVDIVSKSGAPKATRVADVKNRGEYDPKVDFYKPLREHISRTHRGNRDKDYLRQVLQDLKDKNKIKNYPGLVRGYTQWWGSKALTWFNPPSATFSASGVEVSVNPELGLAFNGERHIIKLYFKDETLTRNRVDIVGHLMEQRLRGTKQNGDKMSILDVRSAKLITPKVRQGADTARFDGMLAAELAYIAALWPNV